MLGSRVKQFYTFNSPRYWSGGCVNNYETRKPAEIYINLRRNWKTARRMARKQRKSQFEKFLSEIIDTILHEFAHVFEPSSKEIPMHYKHKEEFARLFAMHGRRTRL